MMKTAVITLPLLILLPASLVFGASIADVPWTGSHIRALKKAKKRDVVRFYLRQTDPEELSRPSDFNSFDYEWYPAGEGKYELVVYSNTGPDISYVTIFWQDAPGKIRSQDFGSGLVEGYDWYKSPMFADLNGDGKTEMIQLEGLRAGPEIIWRKWFPSAECPQVYRLRNGEYVEASKDFPVYYDKTALPQIQKAMAEKRDEMQKRAVEKTHPPMGVSPDDDYFWDPARYLAALVMCKDKILRVLDRDPVAGLAQAHEWLNNSDPIIVDDARIVFQDIGGHDDEVSKAKIALQSARRRWPKKYQPEVQPATK